MKIREIRNPITDTWCWEWVIPDSGTKCQLVWYHHDKTKFTFGMLAAGNTEWSIGTVTNPKYAIPVGAKLPEVREIAHRFINDPAEDSE